MRRRGIKEAFTLLEMTFVIIILGIVAGISSEVIATAFSAHINQKAIYKSSIKTELVATQIANRLAYAIPGSIVARNGTNLRDISNIGTNENSWTVLEWIGYDVDGFTTRSGGGETAANRRPAWSGFADLGSTLTNRINGSTINLYTPGSNLALLNPLIRNLSGTSLTQTGAALYFATDNLVIHNDTNGYTLADNPGIYTINSLVAGSSNQLVLNASNTIQPAQLSERYMLAWSAYAIVVTDANGDGLNDLVLRHNFRPWLPNNDYNSQSAINNQKILLSNVSVFRFTGTESSVRFKICKPERIGTNPDGSAETLAVCKEKVVIK